MAQRRRLKGSADPIVTGRVVVTVGPLQFGSTLREIQDFLWNCGLEYDVEDDGGWLGGTIRIAVKGPEAAVDGVLESIQDWVDANNSW